VATLCRDLLIDGNAPSKLRAEARAVLVRHKPSEAVQLVTEGLKYGSPMDKQRCLQMLGRMTSREAESHLLDLAMVFYRGFLDETVFVEMLEIAHNKDKKRGVWRKVLEKWDANLDQGTDPLLIYRKAMRAGDAVAGRQIFYHHAEAQCARCHQVAQQGGWTGPALDGIGKKLNHDALMKSLIMPSDHIRTGYGQITITLKNGNQLTGMLRDQTADALLLQVGGKAQKLERSKVAQQTEPVSPMPPMGTLLTLRELRDLMAYLETLE
jgi:putative heme-binding domain-containing protein